jgi:hypothetical protein
MCTPTQSSINLMTDLDTRCSALYGQQNDFVEPLMSSGARSDWSRELAVSEWQSDSMTDIRADMGANPLATDVAYGDLRYGDALNPTRYYTYKDDYRIVADRDTQFRFNLNSNYFDTFLQIIDRSTGQLVTWNDNANYSYNSEIWLNVRAGTDFLVRVTSYQAYATGSYSLFSTFNYTSPAPTPAPTPTPTPGNPVFSSVYGYGLVDAGAAVARSLGQTQPFPEVRDLGGNNWGNDLVSAQESWEKGFVGQNVTVAVIDTGVDGTHPDLVGQLWMNRGEIAGNGIDDDRNGYTDDVRGWDFVDGDNNPMDGGEHGTHVAGTIAAKNDGRGVTGVAYGAKIMPIRVLGENGGTGEWISRGIRYAVDNGAQVLNLSLGSASPNQLILDAVRYASQKGAIVVMAAGNDSKAQPGYPAAIATEVGIAVGAIDRNLNMGSFSNLAGSNAAMRYVVAPGVDVYSTVPGGRYDTFDGTSMAAPHVAGVVALMLSANPNLTPVQVRQILTETAFRGDGQQAAVMTRSWDAGVVERRVAPGEFYGLAGEDFEADWAMG